MYNLQVFIIIHSESQKLDPCSFEHNFNNSFTFADRN